VKVRLTTDRVDRGTLQLEGEEIELPEREARALIVAGQAEPVAAPRPAPRRK